MRTPKETKMIVSRWLDQSHGGPQWPKVEMWGAVRKFLGHLCRAMSGGKGKVHVLLVYELVVHDSWGEGSMNPMLMCGSG